MKIKIGKEKIFFSFILIYNALYMFLMITAPELSNKLVLIFLAVTYWYYLHRVNNKIEFLLFNVMLFFYIIYNAMEFGIAQVIHSDFYVFILIMIIFAICCDFVTMEKLKKYVSSHNKMYLCSTILLFAFLIYSVLFQNGFRTGYGSIIPILYGPFNTAHQLAYMLLGVYCGLNCLKKEYRKIIILFKVLCVLCILLVASRAAVLALAVLLLVDYSSIAKANKKVIIAGGILVIFLFLAFFTNMLEDNALISKTKVAIEGGSITNHRGDFVNIAYEYYIDSCNLIQKLFGIGMFKLRNVFTQSGMGGIHVHNDYFNALLGYGAVGLLFFCLIQLKLCSCLKSWKYRLSMFFFLFILINCNGLAMYVTLTPSIPIIVIYFIMLDYSKCGEKRQ